MTVVATAGHVDHGKSALVQALTGTDPDRLAEEKRRGLTIDLGFAHAVLPSGRSVSFVDVPGHSRFLSNMLAGVGGVAACLFVVDALEGWRAQSEEHLRIVDLLGISDGVIAVTKVDLAAADVVEATIADVIRRVAGTALAAADVVAVSAATGRGIDDVRAALDRLVARLPAPADRGRPRLWIDRRFAVAGSGTVVTGTSAGGWLAVDDRVQIEPGGQIARLRGLEVHGEPTGRVGPGERVALNLAGIGIDDLSRGSAVVTPGLWHLTDRFDASITVLAALDHPVSRRGAYVVYIGSGEHPARVRVLGGDELAPGSIGSLRIHVGTRIPLVPGDRLVLRESGRDETVGGGEVLDVDPVLPARTAAPDRRWQRVVAERGWVDADQLARLTGEQVAPSIGRWVVDPAAHDVAVADLRSRVAEAKQDGLPLGQLDERQRALLADLDDVRIDNDIARPAAAADQLGGHPVIAALRAGGLSPPEPDAERDVLRQLRQRGLLVERDGVWFHPDAFTAATDLVAGLLSESPAGFTVSQFRQVAGTTRKYAVPLLNELDARGITRRRADVRIAGPGLRA
jgi:selenocysteine-specific elongation factor